MRSMSNFYLKRMTIGKTIPLLSLACCMLAACSAPGKSELIWDISLQKIGSQSSPRATDLNGDGILDSVDNCTTYANADQFDGDGDGFGNRCDGDFNNNRATNSQDTTIFRDSLGSSNPITDLNHDGIVNAQDTIIFRSLVGVATCSSRSGYWHFIVSPQFLNAFHKSRY